MTTFAERTALTVAVVLAVGSACGRPRTVRPVTAATPSVAPVRVGDSYTWDTPSYADPTHGFVLGASCDESECAGAALRTVDGGRTWRRVTSPESRWANSDGATGPNVTAAGAGVAYVRRDRLWVTRDGGTTWRPVAVPAAGRLLALDVTGSSVWVLASTCSDTGTGCVRLLTGTVGGESLAVAAVQPARTRDVALGRTDADHAWLLDGSWLTGPGRLLATEDGGRTWRQRVLPCRPIVSPGLTRGGYPGGLSVTPAGVVWLARDAGEPANTLEREVFVSTDGGRTWTGGHRLDGKHVTFVGLDATAAVAGDGDRGLLRTDDGGHTWRVVVPIEGTGGLSLRFVDALDGWARDYSEEVEYVTSDGGRTWRPLPRIDQP